MTHHTKPRSLRTRLLVGLALVLGAVLTSSALAVALLAPQGWLPRVIALSSAIVLGVAAAVFLVDRLAIRPLRDLSGAVDRTPTNDVSCRFPATRLRELNDVVAAFARRISRLSANQSQLVRSEKLTSLGRFSASVAREIGNPLASIREHGDSLRKRLLRRAASGEELALLAVIDRESTRIEQTLAALLEYAGTRPPVGGTVDLEDVILSTVAHLREQGALESVDLSLELTNQPLPVTARRHDLERLFVNLLVNAVDANGGRGRIVVRLERAARFTLREPATRRAIPTGEGTIEHPPSSRAQLWLEANDAAEIAKLIVADSGHGIPAALVERIFDPFFTTKPAGRGNGLGLAIVARIVENLGGAVWVTEAREGGAAFHLLLPVSVVTTGEQRWSADTRRRFTPPLSRPVRIPR
jgi:two-component system, NtrC family, sensor kinase